MALTNRTIASTLQDILNVTGDTNGVYRGDNPVSDYLDWKGVRFANCQSLTDLSARGAGYWFDGEDDYIQCDSITGLDDFPVTLMADMRISSGNVGIAGIYNRYDSETWLQIRASNSGLNTNLRIPGTEDLNYYGNSLDDDKWHNCTVVFSSENSRKGYVDGILVGESTQSISFPTNLNRISVGRAGDSTPSYRKYNIKRFLVFNLALTQSEIQEIMYHGIPYKYQGASQIPVYQSDFSAGVDGWTYNLMNLTGNNDGVSDGSIHII